MIRIKCKPRTPHPTNEWSHTPRFSFFTAATGGRGNKTKQQIGVFFWSGTRSQLYLDEVIGSVIGKHRGDLTARVHLRKLVGLSFLLVEGIVKTGYD